MAKIARATPQKRWSVKYMVPWISPRSATLDEGLASMEVCRRGSRKRGRGGGHGCDHSWHPRGHTTTTPSFGRKISSQQRRWVWSAQTHHIHMFQTHPSNNGSRWWSPHAEMPRRIHESSEEASKGCNLALATILTRLVGARCTMGHPCGPPNAHYCKIWFICSLPKQDEKKGGGGAHGSSSQSNVVLQQHRREEMT
jgi:hypothetical protein